MVADTDKASAVSAADEPEHLTTVDLQLVLSI
jgi:hypothetical protein